jgi:hypothetical protein
MSLRMPFPRLVEVGVTLIRIVDKGAVHPSASAMERTRVQALRELRSLLSEVLSTAAADEQVPAAFKNMRNWEFLITRTEARLTDTWKQRFETRREGKPAKAGQALELLSDEETDQALASEKFVSEVMLEQKDSLEDLDAQLAAMSGVQSDPTRENPLGPAAWAEGIRSGVKDLECSPDDRDWLMEQIMPLLADRFVQFYAAMSKQMTSVGYAAPARRAGQRAGPLPPKDPAAAAAAGGFAPEQVEARTGPVQPLMAEGEGFGGDGGGQFEQLLSLITAQRMGGGGDGGGAGAAWVSGDGEAEADAAGPPVKAWTNDDMMNVLNRLQAGIGHEGAVELASAAGLKKAIRGAAQQAGLGGGVSAMPEQAQDTLALVSMLFEVLTDDKRLDERARSQLARLIVPYVRVAVLDRRLFMQSNHPARRVLNLLVDALDTAGTEAKHKSLRDLSFESIEKIVTGFNDDLSIFEPIEQALAAETEASRKRAELAEKRAAEAHAARERREEARDQVADFLSEVLYGRRMPNVLLEFLVGPWQHHQNVTLLREGDAAPEVFANQVVVRDLLKACEKGEIADADKLQAGVAEALASSGQASDAAVSLMKSFAEEFAKIKAAMAPPPPAKPGEAPAPPPPPPANTVVVEQAVLQASAAAIVPADKTKDAFVAPKVVEAEVEVDTVAKYESMLIGHWIDLVAEGGKITSARISFISPISGKRILSNRRGQRILCASVQELAKMEADGQIKPRHSDQAFENALGAVHKKLAPQAAAPASAAVPA